MEKRGRVMLSKYKRAFCLGALIFLVLPIVSCSKDKLETLSVSEILAQAASVTTVKYELTMQGSSAVTKVWVKGSKWRIELPQQVPPTVPPTSPGEIVSSRVAQGYFVDTEAKICSIWYTPGNVVEEASYSHAGLDVLDWVSAMNKAEFVAESNPKLISTETIDGKSSLLVEFTQEPEFGQESMKGKTWIWKIQPFILRFEMIWGENDTLIMEFKNIDFSDIPDSLFEQP